LHDLKINLVLYHSRPNELLLINMLKNPSRRAEKIRSLFINGLDKLPDHDNFEFSENSSKTFKFTVTFDSAQPDEYRFINAYLSIPFAARRDWTRQRLVAGLSHDQASESTKAHLSENKAVALVNHTELQKKDYLPVTVSEIQKDLQTTVVNSAKPDNSSDLRKETTPLDFDLTALGVEIDFIVPDNNEINDNDRDTLRGLFS